MNVWRTHTWAEIGVNEDDPTEVFHSSGGSLYRSRDAGETWQALALGEQIPPPDESVLVFALAVDGADVYGVLNDGTAWISHDHGDTWEGVGTVGRLPARDDDGWRLLLPTSDGESTFLAAGGHLFVSPDTMRSWVPTPVDVTGAYSLVRVPEGVIVGSRDGYSLTRDEGESWEIVTMDPVDLAVVAAGELVLITGETLHAGGAEHTLPFMPMFLAQADGGLLVGHEEGVSYSDDGGASWVLRQVGMTDPGMSVVEAHPLCADRVLVASLCSGGVYTSEDHGGSWTHADGYLHYVMDVRYDPRDPDRVWSISDDALLVSEDGGGSWTIVHEAYHFHGFAVDPEDSDRLLLGSVGSGHWNDATMRVYVSEDAGGTWVDASAGLPESQASAHVLHFVDGDTVLLGTYRAGDETHNSGNGVGLYRSVDRGLTWEATELPQDDVAGLADGPGGVWAATGAGLWRSADGGVTWEDAGPSADWYLSVEFHGDVGLAYTAIGQAWHTRDGGESWSSSGASLSPPGDKWLAQVAINADGTVGYVTVPGHGVYRLGL
jgi:photosystem II stability/assembly factor-like uncharacterized protein